MNDPTVQNNRQPPLMTAHVDVSTHVDGTAYAWNFPVVTGTPESQVQAELRALLLRDPKLDPTTIRVTYPFGVWNEPVDRDLPIIGTSPAPAPNRQPPSAPEQRKMSDAPPPGPLPQLSHRQTDDTVYLKLDAAVMQWFRDNQLTSAEMFSHLGRFVANTAMQMVARERAQPQRRP